MPSASNSHRPNNRIRHLRVLLAALLSLCALCCGTPAQAADAASSLVIVGGDRSYPPYEFLDKDDRPSGYNVELTRAVARVMGLKVEIRLGAWSERRQDLVRGDVDLLEGMSYSDERAKSVDFSPPHTIVHHSIFARKGGNRHPTLADLRGKEVLVLNDGIMQEFLAAQRTGAKVVPVPTHADVLRALASGKHDYAVMAKLPGLYLIRELGLSNLEAVGDPVSAQQYCFAVKKGNAALLARFNEGLAILKNTGEYQKIYNRWLGVLEPPGLSWSEVFKYGAVVVLPLVLLAGGAVLWSRTLGREVAARTAELTREVEERRHAEEELRNRQQQLVQADKMAALGILVSGVAHEINNPNGLILLNLPVVMEAFRDAEPILEEYYEKNGDFEFGGLSYSRMREALPKLMQQMQEGSRRVKLIVEDLKDFARQQEPGQTAEFDLNETVQAALRLLANLVEKSTEHFSVSLGAGIPRLNGSAQRIEQVVVNLLVNACQALPSPERGIELATWFDAEHRQVVLEVRDQGTGIAPEHLPHLTDPFFTTKRESGGTGLGLSVSSGIVKEHGGELSFSSAPGAGTTARLTFALPDKESLS
ncbi:transporter substrate-binding domain-containing protein [Geomonas sp. Red69]|uniref:transporter substrate-binding domain-containing protein n=1 Tax=Geomonas diazotrophica TaxID=2843197 RepID=UPI001C119339|nr:transporter substrate-binding domain-containing protein [Geomonas diazotrophica]MBU5637635.1 transporter substrate-binding domain-containing protein [Geomonas diazotrophica]